MYKSVLFLSIGLEFLVGVGITLASMAWVSMPKQRACDGQTRLGSGRKPPSMLQPVERSQGIQLLRSHVQIVSPRSGEWDA